MRLIAGLAAALSLFPAAALQSAAFGQYNREPISNYDAESSMARLARPVGRVDVLLDGGQTAFCTGFLVEGDRLITANHCVPGLNTERKVEAVQLVMGFVNDGVEEGTQKFTVNPVPLETNADIGFSVLKVFGNPTGTFGAVSLADYDPPEGTPLWLVGHPQGKALHVARESCRVLRDAQTESQFAHSCDTLGGDSAAPLFDPETGQAVGMHFSGSAREAANFALRSTSMIEGSGVLRAGAAPTGGATPHALLDALMASNPAQLVDALDDLARTSRDPSIRAKAQRLLDTLRLEMIAQD